MAIDWDQIRAVTFDCYGTLIDWEAGILAAVMSALPAGAEPPDATAVLQRYAELERRAEAGAWRPYHQVLGEVGSRLAAEFGLVEARLDLAGSVGRWPAFEETPGCLRALAARYDVAIWSNVDDALFAGTMPRLGLGALSPRQLVTAEQVRSYKPGPAHFLEGIRRLGVEPRSVLHVAESRFHDVEPANALGLQTVWVNRRGGAEGSASGRPSGPARHGVPGRGAAPLLEVRTLTELLRQARLEPAGS
jgi:2-haloacid dehalogenase